MGNWFSKRRLKKVDVDRVPKFSFAGQRRWVRVVKVYDGDTVTVVMFLNDTPYKFQLRMSGYDSPEMKPALNGPFRKEEVAAAVQARDFLGSMVGNKILELQCDGWDKFGRLLGKLINEHGHCVNDIMIQHGFGYPYDGAKKCAFHPRDWHPVYPTPTQKVSELPHSSSLPRG